MGAGALPLLGAGASESDGGAPLLDASALLDAGAPAGGAPGSGVGSTFAFFLPPHFPPDIFLLRAGGISASSDAIAASSSDSDDSAAGGSVLPSKLSRIFLSTLATASCFADSPPAGVGLAWPEADCGAAGVGQRITANGELPQTRRSYRGTGEHASSQDLGGNSVIFNA